jgi:hypothetical protein
MHDSTADLSRSGTGPPRRAPVLPDISFAELAAELTIIARDKVEAAQASEVLVARIEAEGQRELDRAIQHNGMRDAVAVLKRRALLAGRAADLLLALAGREREIRALMSAPQP